MLKTKTVRLTGIIA